MTKRDIIMALKHRYDIEELQKDIQDLKHDARVVKSKPVISVIRNSISAKQARIDRLKDVIRELEQ